MNLVRLSRALLVSVPLMLPLAGCSSSDSEDASASDSDDVVAGDSITSRADLFRPSENDLLGVVKASMAGIDHWKLYLTARGFTVRGISATDKIKVVYAVKLDANKKQEIVTNASAMITASDFKVGNGGAEDARNFANIVLADTKALFAKKSSGVAPQGFLPEAACAFMEKASMWILGASLTTFAGGIATMMSAESAAGVVVAVGTAAAGEAIMISGLAVATGWMLWEFTAGMRDTKGGSFGLDGCR